MAAVDELEEQSQQQHQRFLELFGAGPATGEGFTGVSNLGRQMSQQVQDARCRVVNSNFSTTVIPALAVATAGDHDPFSHHAATASTAARVADASAEINTRGAADIAANSRNEAAQFNAIPDPDSPEGMVAALNTISASQAKSLATVQHSAAAEHALGQQAAEVPEQDSPKCEDPTELLHDWADLAADIDKHNANPPDPTDLAAVAEYDAEYLRLNSELLDLSSKLLNCGIPTTINPAPRS